MSKIQQPYTGKYAFNVSVIVFFQMLPTSMFQSNFDTFLMPFLS